MPEEVAPETTPAPEGEAPSKADESPKPQENPPAPDTTYTQADIDRIVQERLSREKKKYADYDDLKKRAGESKTVQQQLDALREDMAAKAKAEIERNGQFALKQVRSGLSEAGIKGKDADELLEQFEPKKFLTDDGQPDDAAIQKFTASLKKVAGRSTPDPDQGKKGGNPSDMDSIIRQMAGRS